MKRVKVIGSEQTVPETLDITKERYKALIVRSKKEGEAVYYDGDIIHSMYDANILENFYIKDVNDMTVYDIIRFIAISYGLYNDSFKYQQHLTDYLTSKEFINFYHSNGNIDKLKDNIRRLVSYVNTYNTVSTLIGYYSPAIVSRIFQKKLIINIISANIYLREEFIRKYNKHINWEVLSSNSALSIELAIEYHKKVNWKLFLTRSKDRISNDNRKLLYKMLKRLYPDLVEYAFIRGWINDSNIEDITEDLELYTRTDTFDHKRKIDILTYKLPYNVELYSDAAINIIRSEDLSDKDSLTLISDELIIRYYIPRLMDFVSERWSDWALLRRLYNQRQIFILEQNEIDAEVFIKGDISKLNKPWLNARLLRMNPKIIYSTLIYELKDHFEASMLNNRHLPWKFVDRRMDVTIQSPEVIELASKNYNIPLMTVSKNYKLGWDWKYLLNNTRQEHGYNFIGLYRLLVKKNKIKELDWTTIQENVNFGQHLFTIQSYLKNAK